MTQKERCITCRRRDGTVVSHLQPHECVVPLQFAGCDAVTSNEVFENPMKPFDESDALMMVGRSCPELHPKQPASFAHEEAYEVRGMIDHKEPGNAAVASVSRPPKEGHEPRRGVSVGLLLKRAQETDLTSHDTWPGAGRRAEAGVEAMCHCGNGCGRSLLSVGGAPPIFLRLPH